MATHAAGYIKNTLLRVMDGCMDGWMRVTGEQTRALQGAELAHAIALVVGQRRPWRPAAAVVDVMCCAALRWRTGATMEPESPDDAGTREGQCGRMRLREHRFASTLSTVSGREGRFALIHPKECGRRAGAGCADLRPAHGACAGQPGHK